MQTHDNNKHKLQAGQELSIRWREARREDSWVFRILKQLRLTSDDNGNPAASAYCTHVSEEGISVYIARGYNYGGDIEGFMPKKDYMWQVYFEPLNSFNQSYAKSAHAKKIFPRDFVQQPL